MKQKWNLPVRCSHLSTWLMLLRFQVQIPWTVFICPLFPNVLVIHIKVQWSLLTSLSCKWCKYKLLHFIVYSTQDVIPLHLHVPKRAVSDSSHTLNKITSIWVGVIQAFLYQDVNVLHYQCYRDSKIITGLSVHNCVFNLNREIGCVVPIILVTQQT